MMAEISKPADDRSMPGIKREDFTEQHSFIIEAAMQRGFKTADDDCTQFLVTDEWLVDFALSVAGAAIEQALRK